MKVLEKRAFMVYDCALCHSKLEADVGDVRGYTDSDGDSCHWIVCPVCGKEKYLSSNQVPPKARSKRH
jgi:DNA-directed RNA polymerase subunit RPC12/RpoP